MLILEQVRHGIRFKTVWYATERVKGTGIIQYRQAEIQNEKKQHVFSTLVSDLTLTEEEIVQKYSKNCRYYVNRAPREGALCFMHSADEVAEAEIDEFINFFVEFWKSKGVDFDANKQESLKNELMLYKQGGALSISRATLENEIVVYHTYVTDKVHARLLHSASLFREEDPAKSNIVGMANRYLHKQDMLAFKEKGYEVYDWGGAGRTEEVKHITEFKESFGGIPKDYYHFEEVKGLFPKLFLWAAKTLKR